MGLLYGENFVILAYYQGATERTRCVRYFFRQCTYGKCTLFCRTLTVRVDLIINDECVIDSGKRKQ